MDKKISELDQALQINNDAVFPFSQDNSGTETTYKASITQLASEIGEDQTYSNLQTTSKNLVGAINEVAQGGGGGGGSSNANIAPDYDSTATYDVGDWCIYNGTLYQCTTAITVAEAFDPTHWTAKKVVDAFDDIDTALSGKVDTSNFYGTLLPMSPNDPDKVADRITALETSVSGKADSSDVYTQAQVNTLLGDKLDSSYLVKTNNGSFSALVKANQVWLIIVQRVSLNTSCVLICHNYNNSVITKEVILDSGMAYVTNSQGTVSITYGGSGESVRGGAYRLY